MTNRQKIEVRQSETRERINALLGQDERTDTEATELRALTDKAQELEVEFRAAVAAEPPEERVDGQTVNVDPETRERLELRGKVSFGRFLLARLKGHRLDGAESEYRESCGIVGDGDWPIDQFEVDRPLERRETELRVDAATAAPAAGLGATLAPVQPFLFAPSIAPMLGIDIPSVGSGAYSTATITTALTAAAKAKGAAQESTAAVLTTATANPRGLTARLSLNLEDIAAIGTENFEAALRENARMVLSDEYDKQCVVGDGTGDNVTGLVKQLTDPADPGAVATFDAFVAAFADQIEGLWAKRMAEVAIIANVDAYKLSAKTFRDIAAADLGATSFADYAQTHSGGWSTNKRMPATAANIARGIVHRRGRPGVRTATHPTWGTLSVDDIYSDAGSRQRHFTLSVLVGDKVLIVQPDAYGLVEFKVA